MTPDERDALALDQADDILLDTHEQLLGDLTEHHRDQVHALTTRAASPHQLGPRERDDLRRAAEHVEDHLADLLRTVRSDTQGDTQ